MQSTLKGDFLVRPLLLKKILDLIGNLISKGSFLSLEVGSMENLLCDELWVSSPTTPDSWPEQKRCILDSYGASFCMTKEECEQALTISLEKELSYMPEPGYVQHLQSDDFINVRCKAIQWLIKSRSRLNISFGTIFCAASYLDRFISMSQQCHKWKYWMVELLSVACLSIASKFSETSTLSLNEIQMEDLNHSFQSSTIKQMELILLQAIGWHLGAITSYSYVELLITSIDSSKSHLHKELIITRVTELLLKAILDCKMLEYPPSIVAASALWCSLEEFVPSTTDAHLACITSVFNQDQKDNLVKCRMIMKVQFFVSPIHNLGKSCYCPSSLVTVLLRERIQVYNCHVDFSLFELPGSNINHRSNNKRKREE